MRPDLFACLLFYDVIFIATRGVASEQPVDTSHGLKPMLNGPIANFKQKIVHLDLKGAPLSVPYMVKIFPMLREMNVTGLLIEYEDMFPYSGPLTNLSAKNHYSEADIGRILEGARSNSLTVVPLIQTFGHLEFSLKLAENIGLREQRVSPDVLCPSFNASVDMVREMLRQVVNLHRGHITHLHIGCDEVYSLGLCSRCLKRMFVNHWTRSDLFLDHVYTVASTVKEFGLQPIMWDDMLRKIDLGTLLKYKRLTSLVEIMVWSYGCQIPAETTLAMRKYEFLHVPAVWFASAFKGGSGPTNQMPKYRLHLSNHIAWSVEAKRLEGKLNIAGIAITGWQRVDHFSSLCELFPVGLPVLSLCMAYLNTGSYNATVLAEIQKRLKCNRPLPLDDVPSPPLLACSYPGSDVLVGVQQFNQILLKRQIIENDNIYQGWMTAMNEKHNFSSPRHLGEIAAKIGPMLKLLASVHNNMRQLSNITDAATWREWMETFLWPQVDWTITLKRNTDRLISQSSWPRRPLYDEL